MSPIFGRHAGQTIPAPGRNDADAGRKRYKRQLERAIARNDDKARADAAPKRIGKHFYQGEPDHDKYLKNLHPQSDVVRKKMRQDPDFQRDLKEYFDSYDRVQDLMEDDAEKTQISEALKAHADAGVKLGDSWLNMVNKYESELLSANLAEIGEEDTIAGREILKEIYTKKRGNNWWMM